MSVKCHSTELRLAAESHFSSPHLEGCLRCQASRARYRQLGRELEAMRHQVVPAPAGLVDAVLGGPGAETPASRRFPAEAVAVAGLAAAAGAAAGALSWWRRRSA